MSQKERAKAAIVGALVADAAALGFHWLYDQNRIRALAPQHPEFRQPDKKDFEGVAGYFAHGKKSRGEISQYGEQTLVMLRALAANSGVYSKPEYETHFRQHFGYGGDYCGYVDHAIRETLDNMARAEYQTKNRSEVDENFHGADDVQMPALAKLPALVACYAGKPDIKQVVESAIRVTNNNQTSVDFGLAAADILERVILGAQLQDALHAVRETAAADVAALIEQVLAIDEPNNQVVTQQFGLACNLISGFPSAYHNVLNAKSFQDAVRQNIYSGGDSCGRAIFLGAILGACWGIGTEKGIAAEWIAQVICVKDIDFLCENIF